MLVEAGHTALLIKFHKPTVAMKARFCHLLEEATATSFSFEWHLLYYAPDAPHDVLSFESWCRQPYLLHADSLTAFFGKNIGEELHKKQKKGIHEFAFHAMHRSSLSYDMLWVLEQDVAWQGNLFDLFATFATWNEDVLCDFGGRGVNPLETRADVHDSNWSAWSSWAEAAKRRTATKCLKFVVRYSRRLLDVMIDFLKMGHWAQDEWFATTVCAGQAGNESSTFLQKSCTIADYYGREKLLFNVPFFTWEAPFHTTNQNGTIRWTTPLSSSIP